MHCCARFDSLFHKRARLSSGSEGKKGQTLKTARRALFILIGVSLGVVGLYRPAQADALTCFRSTASVQQGGTLTITGSSDTANDLIIAILDGGTQIGSGVAGAVAPFNFSFTATIPVTATAPAVHTLATQDADGPPAPCDDILVTQAAATLAPTPAPGLGLPAGIDPDDVIDAIADSVADAVADRLEDALGPRAAVPVAGIPVAFPAGVGGAKLPTTGVDVAEVGGVGTLSLMAGVTLMEFARRRRKNWLEPMSATEAISTPVAPRSGEHEADLLLPYLGPTAPVDAAPDRSDFVTPTF